MNLKNILSVALCLLSAHLFAQSAQYEIRLSDFETTLPITHSTFEYGEQRGVSDENGIIRFRLEEGKTMTLSHIQYGAWTLETTMLQKAIERQVYYRKSITTNLYPVTIIGYALKMNS